MGLDYRPRANPSTPMALSSGWQAHQCRMYQCCSNNHKWVPTGDGGGGCTNQGQIIGGQIREEPISTRPKLPRIQGWHLKCEPTKPSSVLSTTLNILDPTMAASVKNILGTSALHLKSRSPLPFSPPPGICVGPLLLNLTSMVPHSLASITDWVRLTTPTSTQPQTPQRFYNGNKKPVKHFYSRALPPAPAPRHCRVLGNTWELCQSSIRTQVPGGHRP